MRSLLLATAALPLIAAAPALAQDQSDDFHTKEDIVVTAPYVRSLDVLGNITVIDGDELARDMRGQIGETLTRQAGVSATSFSPGASRPVLRGFQGERVRILTDGIGAIDVSNTSADHAVTIDPLTAERVEVLRGPAVLLFGSQAIGGAVNIFDRRIPRGVPEAPFHLDAIAGYGSAANDRSGGVSIDVPLSSQIVFHADGSYRNTDDVRTGGYILAPGLRGEVLEQAAEELEEGHADEAAARTETANRRGKLPNSASETWTAAAGLAVVNERGQLGISVAYFDSNYGIPSRPGAEHHHEEEEEGGGTLLAAAEVEGDVPVTIGLKQWRADVRGEVELGDGAFEKLRLRGGFADYTHTEFEGDEVGTVFTNQGAEMRLELTQNARRGWRGASGVQYHYRDFDAVGAEAFVPKNFTEQFGVFTLQEWEAGPVGIDAALRYEKTNVSATRLGIDRRFSGLSGALGVSYELSDAAKFSISAARTVRAPSAEELFSDGPHIATQSYERGDATFGKEKSWGTEATLKYRGSAVSASLTGYANWFDGFIYAADTGLELDELPLFQYRQSKARTYGFEFEASARLAQAGGFDFFADVVADMTRAKLANGGGAIPRIPPLRLLGGLEAKSDRLDARVEAEWTDDQTRIAAFETATKGFTLVNASLAWRPLAERKNLTLSLSANNIFDVAARRHASFTKDFAPLSGRDVRVSARVSF